MKQLIISLTLLVCAPCIAQISNKSALTIDQIMQGDDFVGYLPTNIHWAENSETIYFNWNPNQDTIPSIYQVDINSKKIDKLSFEDIRKKTNTGVFSKNGLWSAYEKEGDLFLMNTTTYTKKTNNIYQL